MPNASKRCKNVARGVFLKDPGPALFVCGVLYVSIEKMKEEGDESGATVRERGKKRMPYVSAEVRGD